MLSLLLNGHTSLLGIHPLHVLQACYSLYCVFIFYCIYCVHSLTEGKFHVDGNETNSDGVESNLLREYVREK